MDANLLSAIVTSIATAGSTAGVAITAIVLNNKRFESLERRLESIERDLKEFFKAEAEHDREIARLKDHTGLK